MQTGHKLYNDNEINLYLNNTKLSICNEFKYLGYIINNKLDDNTNFLEKFNKCEKSYYSLYKFGVKPIGLNPYSKAHILNSYCLPKATYGLGLANLNTTTLKKLNTRQNLLMRSMVGLHKQSKISELNSILRIFKFETLYDKYKCSTIELLKRHPITTSILNNLTANNNIETAHKKSIIHDITSISNKYNVSNDYLLSNTKDFTNIIKNTNLIDYTNTRIVYIKQIVDNFDLYNMKILNQIMHYTTNISDISYLFNYP